ncbi:MAG: glycosyltransferase family 2 protein [Steroidobacteraceae bacterium]
MSISVCIATYRRNERLSAVLSDLSLQELAPNQVVIVDNDANGGARAVVDQFRTLQPPFTVDYDIQPQRNIALTRNRSVELASCQWMAFIDDDERAPVDWLRKLMAAAQMYQADGVLGPVEPQLPEDAPAWIRRGRFFDFPHEASGVEVPLNRMRFGNVLLLGERLRAEPGPFDPRYGLMTGEDGDLLVRLVHRGAKIIWFDEAPVFEPIEQRRLSLRWLMMRALSGGQEFARQTLNGRYRPISWFGRCCFLARAIAQLLAAAALAILVTPLGRHRVAAWLIKAWANLGKLSAFWGWRYSAYS